MSVNARRSLSLSPSHLPGGIHYAWFIVAILALVQVIGSSIGMSGGIIVPILNDSEGSFGWSMAIIGAAFMVYYLTGAISSPISGWLGDRYGPRRMLLAGGILYATSMILMGLVSQSWHFFLTFSFMMALTQAISMVSLMAAVIRWFRRSLGLGTGILWAASGIGSAALAPLMSYLMGQIGWQATFWSIGIVGGGILILLTVVFRDSPADLGIKPYGATDDEPPSEVKDKAVEHLRLKVFNQHMRRTRAFWNLPVIHSLGCAGHGIVLIYAVPLAVDRDISLVSASIMLSLISLVSVPSRLITPVLAEAYSPKMIMSLCLFVQGATVLLLFWAQDVWMFYLFATLFGMGFGGEWTGYLVINRKYFGEGPLAGCYGWQMSGAMMGHAIAMGLAGLILYVTGSYNPVLAMSMVFSLGGVVVILTLEPTSRVLIPRWEESLPPEARSISASRQEGTTGAGLPEPAPGDD
uniref:Integral membrane transporter n=1 Tax=uncultured marine group II/III euryarchaeote KM3_153_G11 TaxID=1457896 RepID=A0A075GEH6_9EURY|nr:integral membrane transporter [uncultured marine group II/III euryarchaeote KM3_153_G11]